MDELSEISLEYDYRKQRYESYVTEREALRTSSLEISGRYDKWILGLSGAALALSITFLEKIAPTPISWTFVVLAFAWFLFILAVVMELYAIASSQSAINEELALLAQEYNQYLKSLTEEKEYELNLQRSDNQFSSRTRNLNKWSLRALTLGVVLLCLFSIINLPYK